MSENDTFPVEQTVGIDASENNTALLEN
jgi:hypothetical protein